MSEWISGARVNEHGTRVSRHHHQAYDAVFTSKTQPGDDDPGWIIYHAGKRRLRALRVHGPFDVEIDGVEVHCQEGWLTLEGGKLGMIRVPRPEDSDMSDPPGWDRGK